MERVSVWMAFFLSAFSFLSTMAQTNSTLTAELIAGYPKQGSSFPINLIPIVPITINNFYLEVRYNYDFQGTVGAYAGKVLTSERKVRHILIPQVGILKGDFNGGSFQSYYRMESNRIEVNFQHQYSISVQDYKNGFYYNWSSLEVKLNPTFSVGGSTQIYFGDDRRYNDNGAFVAFRKSNFSLFLFDFNAYDSKNHYVLTGLAYSVRLSEKPRV